MFAPESITRVISRPAVAFLVAISSVSLVTVLMLPLREPLGAINVLLIFLLLSWMQGLFLGTRAAIVGAVLSFLSFDMFFLEPYYTLTVAAPDHVLAMFVYLLVSVTTAIMMSRIHERGANLIRANKRVQLLYDLNRELVQDVTLDSLLQTVARSVVEVFGARACRVLVGRTADQIQVAAVSPMGTSTALNREALAMIQWAIDHRQDVGLGGKPAHIRVVGTRRIGKDVLNQRAEDVLFIPVIRQMNVEGVIEVSGRRGGGSFTEDDARILRAFADQTALALDRTRMLEENLHTRVLEESDAMKSALMAAVSHELRTPLTAIKASASVLRDTSVEIPPDARNELLHAIDSETDRLTLMIGNLLDLTRIEGGALKPDRDWHDIHELIEDSVQRSNSALNGHSIVLQIEDDIPLVSLDWVHIQQVLMNLIINSAKYAAPATPIVISAHVVGHSIEISVRDQGPGLNSEQLAHVFDRFYRADVDSTMSGSGLGLAISKGLVEAHGGTIAMFSTPGQGTTTIVNLPLEEARS